MLLSNVLFRRHLHRHQLHQDNTVSICVFHALRCLSKFTPQVALFRSVAQLSSIDTDSSSDEQNVTAMATSTIQDSSLQLETKRVIEILSTFRSEPKHAFSFYFQVKESGFRHNVETCMKVIEILSCRGSSSMLEGLLLEVLKSKEGMQFNFSELLEALLEEVVHKGIHFLVRAFDALVKVYVSLGMFDECIDVISRMGRQGLVPHVYSCNFLINRFIEHGKPKMAMTVYHLVKKLGLSPNVYTYNLLIKALCRNGCLKEAGHVFKKMEETGVNPNAYSYTIYIEGLCSLQKSDLAYEVLKAWRSSPTRFDNFAYDAVVRGFCNEKRLREAEAILVEMENLGSTPSVYCFGALILAYCKTGNVEKTLSLHSYMLSKGVKVNCVILSSILHCLRSTGLFAEAVYLFRTYHTGVFLDGVCYDIVLDAMCKLGRTEEASELLEEMKCRSLVPGLFHYSTLINGYCLNGKPEEACILFNDMKCNGLEPDMVTYNILAGGLARNGLVADTKALLDYMKSQGLAPGVVTKSNIIEGLCVGGKVQDAEIFLNSLDVKHPETFSAMINGLCKAKYTKEAFNLFLEVHKQGIVVKKKSHHKLLSSLCMEGEIKRAILLFEILSLEGSPCIIMYSKLITALCNAGEMDKAQSVFDSWFKKGFCPDAIMYTIMINGYCKSNRLSEAFRLLQDMKRRGIIPDVITYTVLLDGGLKSTLGHSFSWSKVSSLKVRAERVESELRKEMSNMQIRPDVVCYTVLIDKRCKLNDVQDAVKLFHEMMDHGLQPDTVTYTALVSGCCRVQDVDAVVTLVNAMEAQGLCPDQKFLSVLGILKAKKVQLKY